jgi:DnaB-like helicase N terminal domain/AAA domain
MANKPFDLLPRNLEAERDVLGAILLDNKVLSIAAEILEAADFEVGSNRDIFWAMLKLDRAQRPINLVTLAENLGSNGRLEAAGGPAYLGALMDGRPKVSDVAHSARIVKEKAMRRNAAHAFDAIHQQALDKAEDLDLVLDRAERMILFLREGSAPTSEAERLRHVRSLTDILPISALPDPTEEMVVERLLQRGGTTMLSGPPAKYKSWLALLMCREVLRAGKFLGRFPCRKMQVVYLDRENTPGRIKRR